jgi:azurin
MLKQTIFVVSLAAIAAPAMAQQCATTIESNDAMQFNVANIDVSKKCKEFVVTLKHVGKLPKAAMGHNLVVTKTADMTAVSTDGMAAGVPNDYVKVKDARVLAQTKLIGGGETTTTKIAVASLSDKESYVFFCTFPGHSSMMKGTLKLVS